MGWSSAAFNTRPFNSGAQPRRQTQLLSGAPENGWAAWTYSKTAKLNAWSWHGLGVYPNNRVNAWASIGSSIYLRRDNDESIYVMRPDVFRSEAEINYESEKVYAETQWLDFGKPGELKGLTGIDFDGLNVTSVDIMVSVDGDRDGALVETIPIGNAQGGWTYSGGIIPLTLAGTEFKLRFTGDPDLEVQVNRLSLHWDSMGMM